MFYQVRPFPEDRYELQSEFTSMHRYSWRYNEIRLALYEATCADPA